MSADPTIILNYFNLRGRAQFIRGLLSHHNISFVDNRITLSANNANWPGIRQDRTISGDFQKIPTLQWDDMLLNEVLVILDFIQQKLGNTLLLDEKTKLRHDMLTSSVFLDLLTPCVNLIWCDIFYPGTDIPATTAGLKRRLEHHLITVNQTLEQWHWLKEMKNRPVMAADAVLWEALDVIRLTFDEHVGFEELDALSNFYDNCEGASTFKKLLAEKTQTITGRPGEAEALLIIHESLNDSLES